MSASTNLEMVKNSPFGAELTDAQCEKLATIIEVLDLETGDFLIREGEIDNKLYVSVSGRLSVIKSSGNSEEELHVLGAGSLAGAMGFLDGKEHSASLKAKSATKVFCIDHTKFEAMIETDPRVVYQIMRTIVRDIHGIVKKMNTNHVELSNYINQRHGRY